MKLGYYGHNRRVRGDKVILKVTTGDLARLFGVSKRTIRRWIQSGRIAPHTIEDLIANYLKTKEKDNAPQSVHS